MSQNKTVIQGLEPADTRSGGQMDYGTPNFYSRGNRPAARGTVVPGMMETSEPTSTTAEQASKPQVKRSIQPGKPVVGFLYSISRTPAGEFWPLQIGRNTIGQKAECDIVLPEGTVTGEHAVIVVRQIKNTGGVIAAITDTQSTNGTMINGETIGFSAVECHNNDVITIGNNYELVLILIDASKLGLSVSKDFVPVEIEDDGEDVDPIFEPGGTRPGGGFDPYNASWGNAGYTPTDGTVGLDGSISGNNHGGTVPM